MILMKLNFRKTFLEYLVILNLMKILLVGAEFLCRQRVLAKLLVPYHISEHD